MDDPRELQAEQVAKAVKLQTLLLDHWTSLAENKTLSSMDCATIARLLSQNGWSLDPNTVPQPLRAQLTSDVKFDDGVDGDAKPRLVREA